jgi:Poxvirus A32 protein
MKSQKIQQTITQKTPIDLEFPFRLMFIARSQMGKTTLLVKLLVNKWIPDKRLKKVYIFCPTYHLDTKWSVVDRFVKEGVVEVFLKVDKKILESIWKRCIDNKTKNENTGHTLIIFDDCMGQKDFKTNSEEGIINKLTCKGNHANISTVWCVQKLTLCSTIMRSQVEGIVVFFCQEKELRPLHQEYGTGSLNWFRKLVELSTSQNYHTLFINRQGPGRPRYFHNFKLIDLESIK